MWCMRREDPIQSVEDAAIAWGQFWRSNNYLKVLPLGEVDDDSMTRAVEPMRLVDREQGAYLIDLYLASRGD